MFRVKVMANNKESDLKKDETYTVYHIHWHIASAIEGNDKLFFLIYNKRTARFIYELCSNFEPVYES